MAEIEEKLAENYELEHHKGLTLRLPKEDLIPAPI